MKIAIFGGAFDPPTIGHYNALSQIKNSKLFDKIIIVPSFSHANKKNMTNFNIRHEMLKIFIKEACSKSENIKVSTIEKVLSKKHKTIYTSILMDELQKKFINDELVFCCGSDNYLNFDKTFTNAEYIKSKWDLFEIKENLHIRSTQIRNMVANNEKNLLGYVGASKLNEFILSKNLYK